MSSLDMNQRTTEDSLVTRQETAQTDDQWRTSHPPTMQDPVPTPDTETKNTTNTSPSTNAIAAFLISMKSHYDTLSDPITPHLFTQLCKDYNTRKLDETAFYVAVYRLFFETNATHLVPGLRAFLPSTWREVDMEWLDKAVEDDSERQRASARNTVGELAAMMESNMREPRTPSGSAVALKKKLVLKLSATQSAKNKKRAPLNGFRATYRTDLETPLRSGVPTPRSDSSAYWSLSETSASPPTSTRRPKNITSPPTKVTPLQKSTKAPSSTISLRSPSTNHATPPTLTKATPTPNQKNKTPSNPSTKPSSFHNLPPASSLPHFGSIYPTTRAILARPSHKPYIHALCGMRFGHPAEVQRHHIGQSGRPGCWEKSGKPEGEEGKWDRHESCGVKLANVEYVKVREGWVVLGWGGGVGERILGEGEVKGLVAKGGVKPQLSAKVEPQVMSEDEGESASQDGEEVDGDTETLSSQEPGAKRQKLSIAEESTTLASEEYAAVRAAALGLRARK